MARFTLSVDSQTLTLEDFESWALGIMSRDMPGDVESWSASKVGDYFDRCGVEEPDGEYTCSLPDGHDPRTHRAFPDLEDDILAEWDDDDDEDEMRPATEEETDAWLSGHQTIEGAVETEHGLLVPQSITIEDEGSDLTTGKES